MVFANTKPFAGAAVPEHTDSLATLLITVEISTSLPNSKETISRRIHGAFTSPRNLENEKYLFQLESSYLERSIVLGYAENMEDPEETLSPKLALSSSPHTNLEFIKTISASQL